MALPWGRPAGTAYLPLKRAAEGGGPYGYKPDNAINFLAARPSTKLIPAPDRPSDCISARLVV